MDRAARSWCGRLTPFERPGGKVVSFQYAMFSQTVPPTQPLHLIDEISHRVVNEYTEAICALGQAATASRDIRVQLALTSAASRLRAQVEAHRALQAPIVEGPMDLGEYVGQLCACLAKAPLGENGMRLSVDADEIWLDAGQCWRVGLIVAELVRNAARHGLSGAAGAVWVLVEDEGDRIICSVCDDGGGEPTLRPGRGRRLVQALAAELGGSVEWTFAPAGCCVRLEFSRPDSNLIDLQSESPSRVSHFPQRVRARRFV
jgi:two-component sensor histidine kinase